MYKGIKNFFRNFQICAKIVSVLFENRAIFAPYCVSCDAYCGLKILRPRTHSTTLCTMGTSFAQGDLIKPKDNDNMVILVKIGCFFKDLMDLIIFCGRIFE